MIESAKNILVVPVLIGMNNLPFMPTVWAIVGLIVALIMFQDFFFKNVFPACVAGFIGILLPSMFFWFTGNEQIILLESATPFLIIFLAKLIDETEVIEHLKIEIRHKGRVSKL